MVQVLQKGANVSLTKIAPHCNEITIVVKWLKKANDETEFDIDASAFMLTENNKVRNDDDFIFYNQSVSPDNAIELINSEEYNSQAFKVVLSRIAADINKVSITLTLHEAKEREQNFSMLEKITIEVLDSNKTALATYVLHDSNVETALILADLYRYNGEWKFRAVGQGYEEGLDILAKNYGVDIDSEADQTEAKSELIQPSLPKSPEFARYIEETKPHIEKIKDKIKVAKSNHLNEAETRIQVIDVILQNMLGYQSYHIEREQKAPKTTLIADYLLTIKNKATMVVEAKKIGQILGEKHIWQAAEYAYYLKVDFALLTNGMDWQLYYVKPEKYKKYSYRHVFSINFLDFNDDVAEKLFSISRFGVEKEKSFEAMKSKINALDTIWDEVVYSDEIIEKIATIINSKSPEHKVTHKEVRNVMEENAQGWLD